jgi:glutamate N-acetyltransferase/amino-acid N-acetyltransferase
MIHPKMATMLGFLSTDASVSPAVLKKALTLAVGSSFNAISIDGCMSTNDMVLCLANGRAQNRPIPSSGTLFQHFKSLLETACLELAQMMVRDGEGATKFVEIRVKGAPSAQTAKRVATAVALSPLVKTALFGGDANWGRIMAAIGASGVKVLERQIDISFGEALLVKGGRVNPTTPEEPATQYLKGKEIVITIHLHAGKEKSVVWTCDLSYEYVKINAAYRS